MYASLTVFTHPARRAVSALLAARRAARQAAQSRDVLFARGLQTALFTTDPGPPYKFGRVAVMRWSNDERTLDDLGGFASLSEGVREQWHIVLQAVGVHGSWPGFSPAKPSAPALSLDEPTVVMIYGMVKPRFVPKFIKDNLKVVEQLKTTEGYLGGTAMADTLLGLSSFSCWRTAREARAFAFNAGAHSDAYKIDRAEQRRSTEFYARFRPLRSIGTIDGKDPFANMLLSAKAVA